MTVETNYAIATLNDIYLKSLASVFNQREAQPKPIALRKHDFSRALSKLQVYARNSDWFIAMFAPVVIGRSNYYFGIGFTTVI